MQILYSINGDIKKVYSKDDYALSISDENLKTLVAPFQYDIYQHPRRYKVEKGQILQKNTQELLNTLNALTPRTL